MNIKNFKKFAKKPCNFHCLVRNPFFIENVVQMLYHIKLNYHMKKG